MDKIKGIHPLAKLLCTFFYIVILVSFDKYSLMPILVMCIYPIIMFGIEQLSLAKALTRLRFVMPVVVIIGITNPFFDREIMLYIGGIGITGGMISFLSLILKGIFAVLASYILIETTSIEEICYALQLIKVPSIMILVVLLIGRYLHVLKDEATRITNAYKLRAPRQRGIHYSAWGSLLGMMTLRSIDRAKTIYESMCLRGFRGEFCYERSENFERESAVYLVLWIFVFTLLRFSDILSLLGGIII